MVAKHIIQTKFIAPKSDDLIRHRPYAVLERQRKLEKGGIRDCKRNPQKGSRKETPG